MGIIKKFRKSADKKQEGLDLLIPDEHERLEYISKIEDNDLLLDIALNDPHIDVRIRAVELISDEVVLKDIAYNNSNSRLRVAAVGNSALTNEKVFLDLAEDSNKDVRIAAINRIEDEDILRNIANRQSNKEVKRIALDRIK